MHALMAALLLSLTGLDRGSFSTTSANPCISSQTPASKEQTEGRLALVAIAGSRTFHLEN
jgi:hypothetical protein